MTETLPSFPMARAGKCPFDPPPQLSEVEPISRVEIWNGDTPWLVTSYNDQRKILADNRFSANTLNPGYPHQTASIAARRTKFRSFIAMDDPQHAQHRKMLTSNFMIKRVEALRPQVQQMVDGLIDDLLAGPKPADLVTAFALPVPSLVICQLLGVPYEDHDFFQACGKRIIKRDNSVEDALIANEELRSYLIELVETKKQSPTDDMIGRLVTEQLPAGELTESEIADMSLLMLLAGHETTANMIALGTLALLRHPDQLAILRDSPDQATLASAVEELLRYLNITHTGRRRALTADIEVDGVTLRAGEGIVLANDIGNRDPEVFDDPDRLDLRRDARRHVAFGFGVHQCLGQPLARMELQVVYGTLYRRIPTLRLAADFEQIPFKHDGFVYGVYELPVAW